MSGTCACRALAFVSLCMRSFVLGKLGEEAFVICDEHDVCDDHLDVCNWRNPPKYCTKVVYFFDELEFEYEVKIC
jgi:hypothetical protein